MKKPVQVVSLKKQKNKSRATVYSKGTIKLKSVYGDATPKFNETQTATLECLSVLEIIVEIDVRQQG